MKNQVPSIGEGLFIKDLFKTWSVWCGGIVAAVVLINLIADEAYGWGRFIGMCAGGLIGISIGVGIKGAVKNSRP
ncbi:hypothetical protein LCM20_16475 [Halobacillus litoralis]|uniref:hypothetical protein n=1 Tax=Halobacillus litoralis TaxID=45668 RepID=UPI001CD5862E|nr:hypothetical protein [Halobacillus litoralis]MCA0972205.1 hypothetical protein [Halobacillus litoralis]